MLAEINARAFIVKTARKLCLTAQLWNAEFTGKGDANIRSEGRGGGKERDKNGKGTTEEGIVIVLRGDHHISGFHVCFILFFSPSVQFGTTSCALHLVRLYCDVKNEAGLRVPSHLGRAASEDSATVAVTAAAASPPFSFLPVEHEFG